MIFLYSLAVTIIIFILIRTKLLEKLMNKIKDFFNVMKYKRQRNTALNKYNARNEDYIDVLETLPMLQKKIDNYENQIKEQKKEIKELKRIIMEDMTPKKKK